MNISFFLTETSLNIVDREHMIQLESPKTSQC